MHSTLSRLPAATSPRRMAALGMALFMLLSAAPASAQVNPEIASCSELKDEATITQADLCAAHIGCRFVLNVQKTCARAKSYLERLQAAIGEGTLTLLGRRRQVTPDAVFTATMGAEERARARELAGQAEVQRQAQDIGARVRDRGAGDTLTGNAAGGGSWVYYGDVVDGKANGLGTRVFTSGEVQRGQFENDRLNGRVDILGRTNSRFVGNYTGDTSGMTRKGLYAFENGKSEQGSDWSDGTFIGTVREADGSRFEGTTLNSKRVRGVAYRADGSIAERGTYENGVLSVGTVYDAAGGQTQVDLPAARQAAAREAAEKQRLATEAEALRKRQEAEAEAQRQREEAARAEQQFRASLQTMNPGQLFAKADELQSRGDSARAREVQRTLVSRFPDHPMAAAAARQMAGETTSPATGGGGSTRSGSGSSSKYSSICVRNMEKIQSAVLATGANRYNGTGAGFYTRTMRLMIDVLSPCAAQDPAAARMVADSRKSIEDDERYCAGPNRRDCREWGTEGYEASNRTWFTALEREARAALANPSGYSAELGGGTAPASSGRPAGSMSAQDCAAREQQVRSTTVPPNASITASTETVMFMTRTALDMIDGGCPGMSAGDRKSYQESFASAEQACNQVQAGGRRCVPANHFGPGTASEGSLRTPDPRIPIPKLPR